VLAFAYDTPVPIIETNIRSVYLHHYFNGKDGVSDAKLIPYIARTLDMEKPGMWYAALMDYGSHIKKVYGNPNRKSSTYTKQGSFKGSDRELRGMLLRSLSKKSLSQEELCARLSHTNTRVLQQLTRLEDEGLVVQKRKKYRLPE
jgi:A/G-specific adenine glycosylase